MEELIERMRDLLGSVPEPHESFAEHRGRAHRGMHDVLLAMEERVATLRAAPRAGGAWEATLELWERA